MTPKNLRVTLLSVLIAVSTVSALSPVLAQPFYGPSFAASPASVISGGTVTMQLSSGSGATFTAPPSGSSVCNPTAPSTCSFQLQACDGGLNYYQINQATVTDPNGNAYLLGSAVTSGLANNHIASPRYTSAGFAPAINLSSTDSGSIPFGTGVGGFFALTSNLANPPNNVNPEGPYYWWTVAGNTYGSNLRLDQNPSIQPTAIPGTYTYDLEGLVFCGTFMVFFDAAMQFTVSPSQVVLNIVKTGASNPMGCSSVTGAVGSVMNGGSIAYSVTVSNTGTADAIGVVVSDPQPAGETFGAATATSGAITQTGGVGSWSWTGTIAAGGSVTITWSATVSTSATSVTNVATITSPTASSTVVINGSPASCETLVPQLTTSLSPSSITVGGSATDTATLTGVTTSPAATGTITFNVFSGSTSASCTGTPVTSTTVTLPTTSSTFGSGLAAGNYEVQAVYSGDSNNAGAVSACGSEPLTVGQLASSATSTVFDAATNAAWSGNEMAPASAYDTSTVTGTGPVPTGTVTYTFFTNGACTGGGISAGTETLTATGAVPNSNTEGPLAAGSYSFQASYSGDANYSPTTGACEPFTVHAPPAQITRTLGYWQNHWRYTQFVLQNDLGGSISWSSGSCSVTLSDTGDVLAGMLAPISKTTTGASRSTLDQDRMILAQQLIAAILNNAAFGSSPGAGVISGAEAAFCGTNTTTITNYAQQLDNFNGRGDTLNIPASADSCPPSGGYAGKCLSTISDPQGARNLAKPDFVDWNTPTSISS